MGLDGLLLRAGGKVVAFTMGEQMGAEDTYDVHFEKALPVPGACPMINREFARWVQEHYPEVRYQNHEGHGAWRVCVGQESYYPDLLLEKVQRSAEKRDSQFSRKACCFRMKQQAFLLSLYRQRLYPGQKKLFSILLPQ